MEKLEEMDRFLPRYNLPQLNQEEIENMNGPITSAENEIMIKKFPANKSPEPDDFTDKVYQTFREELTKTYSSETLPSLEECWEEGTLPSSFYEATIREYIGSTIISALRTVASFVQSNFGA